MVMDRQQGGGGLIDTASMGEVERKAVLTNPLLAESGIYSLEHLRRDASSMVDENMEPTLEGKYITEFVDHYEYHQSLQDLSEALDPLIMVAVCIAIAIMMLRYHKTWRRRFNAYSKYPFRADGEVISSHPGYTRSQCRRQCDRDDNCVAFAMPVSTETDVYRPDQATQLCSMYRSFSPNRMPYDYRMDVDPSKGWSTWRKP